MLAVKVASLFGPPYSLQIVLDVGRRSCTWNEIMNVRHYNWQLENTRLNIKKKIQN